MQLFSHLHQVFLWNVTLIIFINILKNSLNIFHWIIFTRLLSHQLHELLKTNLTSIICIKYWHCNIHKCPPWLVPSILSDCFSKIQWSQHSIMVIVQKVKNLFKNFNISHWTLCDNKLFRVKVNISLWLFETRPWSFLRSAVFKLRDSERSSASSHLGDSAHTHFRDWKIIEIYFYIKIYNNFYKCSIG